MAVNKLAVVALGGNALLRGDQKGTISEQIENTFETVENIIPLIKSGYNLVISHGNGPQVGNLLMQQSAGRERFDLPELPLDVCVAETQGSIGYMLVRAFRTALAKHGIHREVCCIVTTVTVSKDDPAFSNPSKRVGRVYTHEQADALKDELGWEFKEEVRKTGTGWRRVVPSPAPIEVMNAPLVKQLAETGTIVIAAGGGGIPVARHENGEIEPIEAVVDKDSASSRLATEIGAEEFYILTDVPYVYVNFRQPNEQKLEIISREEAETYLNEGMFGEGNMAPKIRACLDFLEHGGKTSIITESTKLSDREIGTRITI